MSSKTRSMRRAKKRIDGLGVDRESMTHVLVSLSQKIKDQGNLIREMEILLEEHDEKLEALLDHMMKAEVTVGDINLAVKPNGVVGIPYMDVLPHSMAAGKDDGLVHIQTILPDEDPTETR